MAISVQITDCLLLGGSNLHRGEKKITSNEPEDVHSDTLKPAENLLPLATLPPLVLCPFHVILVHIPQIHHQVPCYLRTQDLSHCSNVLEKLEQSTTN